MAYGQNTHSCDPLRALNAHAGVVCKNYNAEKIIGKNTSHLHYMFMQFVKFVQMRADSTFQNKERVGAVQTRKILRNLCANEPLSMTHKA